MFSQWLYFFDIYDKYIDNNGFLKKNMSDGHVHILNDFYVNQFIEKKNLLNL
jgi:hypothetical protein